MYVEEEHEETAHTYSDETQSRAQLDDHPSPDQANVCLVGLSDRLPCAATIHVATVFILGPLDVVAEMSYVSQSPVHSTISGEGIDHPDDDEQQRGTCLDDRLDQVQSLVRVSQSDSCR
jgi:hypothetical protein